jgi:hypothetical protein
VIPSATTKTRIEAGPHLVRARLDPSEGCLGNVEQLSPVTPRYLIVLDVFGPTSTDDWAMLAPDYEGIGPKWQAVTQAQYTRSIRGGIQYTILNAARLSPPTYSPIHITREQTHDYTTNQTFELTLPGAGFTMTRSDCPGG